MLESLQRPSCLAKILKIKINTRQTQLAVFSPALISYPAFTLVISEGLCTFYQIRILSLEAVQMTEVEFIFSLTEEENSTFHTKISAFS